jgi:hypothetical protein
MIGSLQKLLCCMLCVKILLKLWGQAGQKAEEGAEDVMGTMVTSMAM